MVGKKKGELLGLIVVRRTQNEDEIHVKQDFRRKWLQKWGATNLPLITIDTDRKLDRVTRAGTNWSRLCSVCCVVITRSIFLMTTDCMP